MFEISRISHLAGKADGPLVPLGPDVESYEPLLVPKFISRHVTYKDVAIELELSLALKEDRFEIVRLVMSSDDNGISSRDLTQLALPTLVQQIVEEAVPNAITLSRPDRRNELKTQDYLFLAQLYWFENVRWGSPRAIVSKTTGWSRPNTNFHLKKINKIYGLPGVHTENSEKSAAANLLQVESNKD